MLGANIQSVRSATACRSYRRLYRGLVRYIDTAVWNQAQQHRHILSSCTERLCHGHSHSQKTDCHSARSVYRVFLELGSCSYMLIVRSALDAKADREVTFLLKIRSKHHESNIRRNRNDYHEAHGMPRAQDPGPLMKPRHQRNDTATRSLIRLSGPNLYGRLSKST
jgi:hypothetical protein